MAKIKIVNNIVKKNRKFVFLGLTGLTYVAGVLLLIALVSINKDGEFSDEQTYVVLLLFITTSLLIAALAYGIYGYASESKASLKTFSVLITFVTFMLMSSGGVASIYTRMWYLPIIMLLAAVFLIGLAIVSCNLADTSSSNISVIKDDESNNNGGDTKALSKKEEQGKEFQTNNEFGKGVEIESKRSGIRTVESGSVSSEMNFEFDFDEIVAKVD